MKKNFWQILTSGLCVVLLVIVMAQGKRLDGISQKIDGKIDSLRYELQGFNC